MSRTAPLDIKVVYEASGRRRRARTNVSGSAKLAVVALLNLAAAAGCYYGVWWKADPELRIRLLMHTPIPGLDVGATTNQLIPPDAKSKPGRPSAVPKIIQQAAPTVESKPWILPASVVLWIVLNSLAIGALSMSAGAVTRSWGGTGLSAMLVLAALGAVGIAGYEGYQEWMQRERFTPFDLRCAVGAGASLLLLAGMIMGRTGRRLTRMAAYSIILAAAGSAGLIYVGIQYNVIAASDLPYSVAVCSGIAFAAHSLWGWILLPISSRIPR